MQFLLFAVFTSFQKAGVRVLAPDSAKKLDFLQKKLAEKAKSVKFALPCWTNTKMPFDTIFMIYALLSQNFVATIYSLFPQIFLDWKAESEKFFFGMYAQPILCRSTYKSHSRPIW